MLSDGYAFITIIVIAVMLLLVMSLTLIMFFYLSRKKIVKKEVEKQQLVIDHQKEMIYASIETQEEERKRIAQDLHDDISSKLNVVSLNTQFLLEESLSEEESKHMLEQVLQITNRTLDTSRTIAHNLLPPILDKFGLGAALDELCDDYNNSKKVLVSFENKYRQNFLNSQSELHLFRIVQEFFNNSVKHAKAPEINLAIIVENNLLALTFKDNGKGFDSEKLNEKKGLGLRNIESRVELLHGSLMYFSKPGKGFQATIKIETNGGEN